MTGHPVSRIVWLDGQAGTGKSTFCEALRRLFGGYGASMRAEYLMKGERHPTGLMALRGARLARIFHQFLEFRARDAVIRRVLPSGGIAKLWQSEDVRAGRGRSARKPESASQEQSVIPGTSANLHRINTFRLHGADW